MMIDAYDFCAKSRVIRAIFMALLPLTVVLASLSSVRGEGWRGTLASLVQLCGTRRVHAAIPALEAILADSSVGTVLKLSARRALDECASQ